MDESMIWRRIRAGGKHTGVSLVTTALLLVTLFVLAGCEPAEEGSRSDRGEQAEAAEDSGAARTTAAPTAAAVHRGTTILAEGELAAINPQLPLGFTTNGRLLELHVASGDAVEAGDLIAELDGEALQDGLVDAQLAVRQAENSLAQAQLSLDELLHWEPDEAAVAQAEAGLAAAEANLGNAQSQDSAAAYSVTAARVALEQAERDLDRANDEYTTAFDPGREWELYIDDPSCRTGEQHPNCTGEPYSDRIKREQEWVVIAVPQAEDALTVARANYNLAVAGLNYNSAVDAEAAVANAHQALSQALTGPEAEQIATARLQVEQAQLALEQAIINEENAQKALLDTQLFAPWAGTILSLDSAPGSIVGAGTAVVTLLDSSRLQFRTNNLSERDLAQIAAGQEAAITLKAYPNDPVPGTVERIVPLAEGRIGDAATFTVIIEVGDTELALLPGMTGRVEIINEMRS